MSAQNFCKTSLELSFIFRHGWEERVRSVEEDVLHFECTFGICECVGKLWRLMFCIFL